MKSEPAAGRLKATVIIPTLNEIDGMRAVLHKIDRRWVDQVIIADGGSTDGTVQYCEQNNATVYVQKKRGYGSAIREALEIATGDIIIEFTGDGSSLTEKIPDLIAKINEGCDLVLASRYRDGAVSYDDDALTGIGNWLFTTLTNLMFHASLTDVLVGYRAYRKSSLAALRMDAPGLEWVSQSTIRFVKGGFKVEEIGADEPKRIGGKRKMIPFSTGWAILKLMFREYTMKAGTP